LIYGDERGSINENDMMAKAMQSLINKVVPRSRAVLKNRSTLEEKRSSPRKEMRDG